MAALRTPGRRPTLVPGGAHNAGPLRLVAEVVQVLADLPAADALVVMPSGFQFPHPARIADEQRADLLLNAEVDHLSGARVAQVTNAPPGQGAALLSSLLEPLPAPRALPAVRAFAREGAELFRERSGVWRARHSSRPERASRAGKMSSPGADSAATGARPARCAAAWSWRRQAGRRMIRRNRKEQRARRRLGCPRCCNYWIGLSGGGIRTVRSSSTSEIPSTWRSRPILS
jgi:hypothetical protein